ncbi:hypothetical protein NDI47_22810 [Microcoleus vaginatus GB1-A2]|uniref:hypothetical protein n=1 Tax=Microcoleus vaginatus TaxID=119532 RepID=UPI001684B19A|nr:hypothetical protein [Microcoleus sp. FACHB-61]
MERLNYWLFPGFENIYLEDSYVLSINAKTSIQILLEAVLTENHSLYTQPLPGEQYCYRRMTVNFPHPQTYDLVLNNISPIADPDGGVDYGNIDEFFRADDKYYLRGEWGELTIVSDPPILLDENYLIVRNGENFIQINKDKISLCEWKREREGVISLVYENDFGSDLCVQIEAEQDPEGFEAALGYMNELDTGHTTDITGGGELTFDKIKQFYAHNFNQENVQAFSVDKIKQFYAHNFNQENVQAFSVKFPSSAGHKYSISAITSDNKLVQAFASSLE